MNSITFIKYRDTLKVVDDRIFAYENHVADIVGGLIFERGYCSQSERNHICHVALMLSKSIVWFQPPMK